MTTTTTTRAITARLKAALRAFANKAPRTRRARPALLAIPTLALACSLTAAAAPHAAAANTSVTPAAGHAVASVGCYSSTCVDQGPQEMGCTADAQTVRYGRYYSTSQRRWLEVDLRYSFACNAFWARIAPAPDGYQFYVENSNYRVYETVRYPYSSWYGNMVDGASAAHACFLNGECTDYWP